MRPVTPSRQVGEQLPGIEHVPGVVDRRFASAKIQDRLLDFLL